MIIHTMPQGSQEWLDKRKGKISASEVGEFICTATTATAKKARHALACKKIAERAGAYIAPSFINDAMKRGTMLEASARQAYVDYRGYANVVEVGFLESDCGYYGSSPDVLVETDPEGLGGSEIKCPSGEKHFLYLLNDETPREYYHQVHMSMAVSGRKWWDFVSYCPSVCGTFIPLFVHREYWNSDTDAILVGLNEMADMVRRYERNVGLIVEAQRLAMLETQRLIVREEEVV
jgi:hypothetical protein